ncbi:MAG TPA: phosphatase PAP2 family protein [Candidatus Eisenbacteria bacterium]|nr:phosphatase PAP2 family protein [Candidatus Eisenbacteria bacterium]
MTGAGPALFLLFLESSGVPHAHLNDRGAAMAAADTIAVPMVADSTTTTSVPAAIDSTSKPAPVPKRRGVLRRATHMVHAFATDLAFVATSPLRMSAKDALITAGVVGATVIVYSYDNEIRRATLRSYGDPAFDAVLDVGNQFGDVGLMGRTWPYWVGGAVVGTALDIDPLQSVCLDVIESHLIAGGIRNLAKFVIGRDHPFEAGRSVFFVSGTSMPSGHTSVVFEIATIFTRHTEGMPGAVQVAVGVTSYGIATAVALQRFSTDAHWASDVILGAALGSLVANTVVNRNQERRRNEGLAAGGPTLTPTLGSSGQPALALVWRF